MHVRQHGFFVDAFIKAGLFGVTLIGLITMTNSSSTAAPRSFKLKNTTYYFSNSKSIALLEAALAGDLSRAKQLVVQGANPNDEGPQSDRYNRLRLLHYTIAARNKQAVKILVEVGADPELTVQGRGRAFIFAMNLQDVEMLSLLLDLKPISTLTKDTLEYILFEGTEYCPQCLDLLLQKGIPIDFPDGAGYTILMRVMDGQDYDLAEWLLLKGASVNVEAGGGVTPAYSVEFHLRKWKPGSPKYNKVLHLKKLMEERGAVFPAAPPDQVRARRTGR
jgi:uncharacterized protein